MQRVFLSARRGSFYGLIQFLDLAGIAKHSPGNGKFCRFKAKEPANSRNHFKPPEERLSRQITAWTPPIISLTPRCF
jgi:hypothetical protein